MNHSSTYHGTLGSTCNWSKVTWAVALASPYVRGLHTSCSKFSRSSARPSEHDKHYGHRFFSGVVHLSSDDSSLVRAAEPHASFVGASVERTGYFGARCHSSLFSAIGRPTRSTQPQAGGLGKHHRRCGPSSVKHSEHQPPRKALFMFAERDEGPRPRTPPFRRTLSSYGQTPRPDGYPCGPVYRRLSLQSRVPAVIAPTSDFDPADALHPLLTLPTHGLLSFSFGGKWFSPSAKSNGMMRLFPPDTARTLHAATLGRSA